MSDDPSEKIIKLLEEIRDLTRDRNGKFDEYIKIYQERNDKYVEALQQAKEVQGRALWQRRRFLWILTPLLLLAIGFMFYLAFWVIPSSDEKEYNEQMEQYRMIQTNLQAMPH